MYKLRFSLMVISDVYRSFIQNKTTFTKYCLTQCFSKLPGNFEIYWVRQYLKSIEYQAVHVPGKCKSLAGIVGCPLFKKGR